jgi:hypothetical protein
MSKNQVRKTAHLPSSKVLAALGRMTINHGFLDTVLKGAVMTLAGLSSEEADDALQYEGSRAMREMTKKLAVSRLGKTNLATLKLAAILNRCARLTDKRNAYIHSLWIVTPGEPTQLFGTGMPAKAPSATEINELADDLFDISKELHVARNSGFLRAALVGVTSPKALKKLKSEVE